MVDVSGRKITYNDYKNSAMYIRPESRGRSDRPGGTSSGKTFSDSVSVNHPKEEGLASKAWKLLSRIVDFWSK